ncbi:MAG: DUF72 domain-containing protein [Planctomycetota bacterium]|jgi:uncharacterized protein YecE (DUF72 family)
MSELLLGTSSWSEKSWTGSFYPEGTAPGDQLRHYATQFRTVEADVTYYRVPDARLVKGWQEKTPDGFVLSAKFPRSIVHAGNGPAPNADVLLKPDKVWPDVERFLSAMSLLGEKCGPLVLQFPYFNKKAFTERGPFLQRLDAFLERLPDEFRYGVEIRNRNWLDAELLDTLRRHETALVLVDLLYMPQPADLARTLDLITTDFLYARLIGDRKAVEARTKTFDKIVVDQSRRLSRWAELLRSVQDRVTRAYVYANNHYAGHGPETVRQLEALLDA